MSDDGVSDSEAERLGDWDLANEQRYVGDKWAVSINGDGDYMYVCAATGAQQLERPSMIAGYCPLPRPGEDDKVSFSATQQPAADVDVDYTCGLLSPDEFGDSNVAVDYEFAVTKYGTYTVEGAAALIMHFQAKVTSVEARVYAEREEFARDPAWMNELAIVDTPLDATDTAREVTYLDDKDDYFLRVYRAFGDKHDEDYGGWRSRIGGGSTVDTYAAAKKTMLALDERAPWQLQAYIADLAGDVENLISQYTSLVEGRKWTQAASVRHEIGLAGVQRVCDVKLASRPEASPWYKEQDNIRSDQHPDEVYIRAIKHGRDVDGARKALGSTVTARNEAAFRICVAQKRMAGGDTSWASRVEKELSQVRPAEEGPPPRKKARCHKANKPVHVGGGAMPFIVGSKRAVTKDVNTKRPAPTYLQVPERGTVPFRTDAIEHNSIGERECVIEALRAALGTRSVTRVSLGLPLKGDLNFKEVVQTFRSNRASPFQLRKAPPVPWRGLLTMAPGIYIGRAQLKTGDAHYMVYDSWRHLIFVGGAPPPPQVDTVDQFLYYDAQRPEDVPANVGRSWFVEEHELLDPAKFQKYMCETLNVVGGIDSLYSVHMHVKHARKTEYNTPEHFD